VFVTVGDFYGDGKLDLAVANFSDGGIRVLLNKGDGTFQPAVNYATGSQADSVVVGDLNGDSRHHLYVAHVSQELDQNVTGSSRQICLCPPTLWSSA